MNNMRLTVSLVSIIAILTACNKGAPDIENIDELKQISSAKHFVLKVEGKEYSYGNYKDNFCMNRTDDKNCIIANDLYYAYKKRPSKSVLGNN
jgi:hypothetical protein